LRYVWQERSYYNETDAPSGCRTRVFIQREASKYDELIDFPAWLSTLSEDPRAITYAEQKRRWAEQILN